MIVDLTQISSEGVSKDYVDNAIADKQDAIDDLESIRSGASAGSTAYQKPSGGIPKSDMSSDVRTSLGKADTALQSYTETDPVFSESAAHGITSSDISNWNSKTSNTGTITGITMNGVSKGTSGVVDLGTVLTEHQSLAQYADGAEYDSTNHLIYLKHGNTRLSNPINADDFIKDGMVDTVTIGQPSSGSHAGTDCLIITFNTDAGKTPIEIPLSGIFDPDDYYTKDDIDNAGYLTGETQLSKGTTTGSGNAVTDISVSGHKITLTKGSTFLTSYTETDPVYSASAAAGITSSDISNWIGKTDNVGTITGITMNGSSKGTSGVVNLGTVITSETQLSKGTATGSGNAVTDISVSNHQITLTKGKTFLESETDPVFGASAAAGISSSDISNWNSKTDNVGTITGVTMNGVSKGASGVVDLGTVITSETQLTKGVTVGSGNAVTDMSVSGHQITLTKGATYLTEHQSLSNYVTYDYIGSIDDLTNAELNAIFT